MVEKRFALSGASSVSDYETDEAPERVKRFSTRHSFPVFVLKRKALRLDLLGVRNDVVCLNLKVEVETLPNPVDSDLPPRTVDIHA